MLDRYSGATRVLFVAGDPIAQVQSPRIATERLRARGADVVVVPAQVRPADFAVFVEMAGRMPNVDGIIVTVPHKLAMFELCAGMAPRAASIGAVNVARRDAEGRWFGDMCDGEGYVDGLRRVGCEPRGRRALVVGAGGAGSAIAHAFVDAGVAALAVHDIDLPRRDALLARLRRYGMTEADAGSADPSGFDLVVNATPMGMTPADPLPIEIERLDAGAFVGDVVTQPEITPLMEAARRRGSATMTGLGMFDAVCDRLVDFYLGAR